MVNEVIARLRFRAASHATSGAGQNGNAGQFAPGRVDDLVACLTDCQIGGDNAQSSVRFFTSAANAALQDTPTGRAGFQSNGSPAADVQPSNPDARTPDVQPQVTEIPGLRQESFFFVVPKSDSELFQYLARDPRWTGAQPHLSLDRRHGCLGDVAPTMANMISTATTQQRFGCGASSHNAGGASTLTERVSGDSSPLTPTTSELGMIMKTLQLLPNGPILL